MSIPKLPAIQLNDDQKRIFNRIVTSVQKGNTKTKPLVLFVCGQAGVGKSILIRRLIDEMGDSRVLVCASTGMAARNIGGLTLHRAFSLQPYSETNDECTDVPKRGLSLLIIDEISMCDAGLFKRIERKMRQTMGVDDVVFGGCTVVMFGDLLQIPPVATNPITKRPDWIFKSPLWKNLVQYEELETIMRQENDPEFGNMLRRWRIGVYTESDRSFLNTKASNISLSTADDIVNYYKKHHQEHKNMMVLAFKNKTIARLNRKITYSLFDQEKLVKVTRMRFTRPQNEPFSKVEHSLQFLASNGSRVIVNQNVGNVLVNGEIGFVCDINSQDGQVTSMSLQLPSSNNIVKLPSVVSPIASSDGIEKWSAHFPIHPAYAITYHKAQGQTLDEVFLIATTGLPEGLFYVGASRVRSRQNLHVLTPNAVDAIKIDQEALTEYTRLRVSIGKTPLPIVL